MLSIGIVIRYYALRNKLIIFDRIRGIISCFLNAKKHTRFVQGSIITYTSTEKHDFHFLDAVELVSLPEGSVVSDILFLHHVLEVFYFFLPEHSASPLIFSLFQQLHEHLPQAYSSFEKKLFLCKFFFITGMYPESRSKEDDLLLNLISNQGNIMLDGTQMSFVNKHATTWLHACLEQHPRIRDFKTRHFLKVVGNDTYADEYR